MPGSDRLDLAAGLVSAYVAGNALPAAELSPLLRRVHAALTALDGTASTEPPAARPGPAEIQRSIGHEALISFEDGRPYKALRRHLTLRGLTPEGYRAKYGLPADYPMTAASYSEQRAALARRQGLGRKHRAPAQRRSAPGRAP
ncbi:MucR family transcriptional regulator [Methylobacterium sp. A54F]